MKIMNEFLCFLKLLVKKPFLLKFKTESFIEVKFKTINLLPEKILILPAHTDISQVDLLQSKKFDIDIRKYIWDMA
jgi:hypothetical protein